MTEFTIGTRVRLTEPQEMVYWPQVGYLIPAGAEGVVERLGLGNGNTAVRYPEMGNFVIVTPTFKLERVSQPPPHCDLHHLSQDPQERMAPRDVSSISDDELLRRAVCSARPKRGAFRRDAVMERFMLGSTFAEQLCARFGVDPFETGR